MTGHRDEEIDLLVANTDHARGLPPVFGTDIIVECKTSAYPLNSAGVSRLADHSEERGLRWAILISLNGVTGSMSQDVLAASQAFRDAFTRKRCGIVSLKSPSSARCGRHVTWKSSNSSAVAWWASCGRVCSPAASCAISIPTRATAEGGAGLHMRFARPATTRYASWCMQDFNKTGLSPTPRWIERRNCSTHSNKSSSGKGRIQPLTRFGGWFENAS